ncbi:MAG: hypothetical protein ACF8QF_01380 [Phycisphaerales bacterium]
MAFARERDLVALEPNLLREVRWRGQVVVEAADASVAGTTLSSASSDFVAAGVEGGAAALVGEVAVEVVERVDANTLTVSRVRGSEAEAPAPPVVQGSDLAFVVPGFGAQLEAAHAALLERVGLGASQVVNTEAFRRAEALEALRRIYEAASTGCGATVQGAKAALYARRADAARLRLVVEADLDGDGIVDARRAAGIASLRRM